MEYTIQQAAEKMGVSTKTIRRYIQQGKFPSAYKQDGKFYIRELDIMPFLFEKSTWTPPDSSVHAVQAKAAKLDDSSQEGLDIDSLDTPGQPVYVQDIRRSRLVIDWKWLGVHYERDVYIKDKQRFRQVKLNVLTLAISGSNLLEAVAHKLHGYFEQKKALMESKERET